MDKTEYLLNRARYIFSREPRFTSNLHMHNMPQEYLPEIFHILG